MPPFSEDAMEGSEGFTRKVLLQRSGAAGAGMLFPPGSVWATATAAARARRHGRRGDAPIRNLVISCQENRSFDSYFGFAPQVQRRGFGPPPGFSQPDAAGGARPVFHQTALHGLPTLASRNHAFDHPTPIGPGHEANGAPALPRDGLSAISDLTDLFDFDRRARMSAGGM